LAHERSKYLASSDDHRTQHRAEGAIKPDRRVLRSAEFVADLG